MARRFLSAMLAMAFLFAYAAPALAAGGAGGAPASSGDESLNITGKRVKIVAKSALYGFGGGLVVGLASQVFKKKPKNIFLFGSLGLYAGIFLGVYVVTTSSGPAPYEGPDTYDDFSWNRSVKPLEVARNDAPKGDVQVNLVDLKF